MVAWMVLLALPILVVSSMKAAAPTAWSMGSRNCESFSLRIGCYNNVNGGQAIVIRFRRHASFWGQIYPAYKRQAIVADSSVGMAQRLTKTVDNESL